jgi:hypothetical protein
VTFRKIISVSVIFKKYTSLACDIKNVHVASVRYDKSHEHCMCTFNRISAIGVLITAHTSSSVYNRKKPEI